MQKLNTSRALVALSAASIALIPLAGSLQAAPRNNDRNGPPSHAPAWGYRGERGNSGNRGNSNRGNRGSRDDRYDENDYDDDGDYRNDRNGGRRGGRGVGRENYGNLVTLEGVVTNTRDANEFEVRAGGRTFYVRSSTNVNVSVGDRVVLRGSFNNNDFNAQSVRVLRSGGNMGGIFGNDTDSGNDRRVDFPGTVTRVRSSREVDVRGDNGRTYRVETSNNVGSFDVGSRVRVTGTGSGSRIRNASVSLDGSAGSNTGGVLGDIFGGGNSNVGRTVDFPGRIVSIDTDRNQAVVRGDNGRTYVVRGSEVDGFRSGDRVRVRGVSRAGFIDLRDLDRI